MQRRECANRIRRAIGGEIAKAMQDMKGKPGNINLGLQNAMVESLRRNGVTQKDLWDCKLSGERSSASDPFNYLDLAEYHKALVEPLDLSSKQDCARWVEGIFREINAEHMHLQMQHRYEEAAPLALAFEVPRSADADTASDIISNAYVLMTPEFNTRLEKDGITRDALIRHGFLTEIDGESKINYTALEEALPTPERSAAKS